MRTLRGRKDLTLLGGSAAISYSVIHIKILHYEGCDLFLQVNSNSYPRGSELLFAASNQEPELRG